MKVLVTGSSGGIGSAIVKKFLSCGYEAAGFDIAPPLVEDSRFRHYMLDITADELPELCADTIINNAGVQDSGRDIDVNLKGTMRVTEKYAFNGRVKSVLFIASASASTGSEFPEYAASKGGMVTYMKNVALRLAPSATANSLSPGGVTTELNRHVMDDPRLWAEIMDETPMKKWATPEEIAEWAYFLTAVNRSMTARDIVVDNGESARAKFVW